MVVLARRLHVPDAIPSQSRYPPGRLGAGGFCPPRPPRRLRPQRSTVRREEGLGPYPAPANASQCRASPPPGAGAGARRALVLPAPMATAMLAIFVAATLAGGVLLVRFRSPWFPSVSVLPGPVQVTHSAFLHPDSAALIAFALCLSARRQPQHLPFRWRSHPHCGGCTRTGDDVLVLYSSP